MHAVHGLRLLLVKERGALFAFHKGENRINKILTLAFESLTHATVLQEKKFDSRISRDVDGYVSLHNFYE
ncbi:hypothetical protein CEXT_469401 [Caerostris extrusa]|uniref:Uncharacterized protein n=1 Tax=Caerostris extrusa TaxID=172846 RepID=A0AAV4WMY4_CAEEX|nr:hypothetical protein CEXT_469401 [Caerostris extrusa]